MSVSPSPSRSAVRTSKACFTVWLINFCVENVGVAANEAPEAGQDECDAESRRVSRNRTVHPSHGRTSVSPP